MPRITGMDVAKAAGVSQTTVSFVLNNTPNQSISEQTRQAVLTAAQTLGYRPNAGARTLRRGRSDTVLVPYPTRNVSRILDSLIAEAGAHLSREGLTMVVDRTRHSDPQRRADAWLSLEPAVVIDATLPRQDASVDALRKSGVRIVSVELPGAPPDRMVLDLLHDEARQLQLERLLSTGRRRIVLAGIQGARGASLDDSKVQQLQRISREQGATLSVDDVDVSEAGLREAVARWDGHVDGVCAFNDELAIGLLYAMNRRGIRVPTDVSLIGIDDEPLAAMVGLTTVGFEIPTDGLAIATAVMQVLNDSTQQSYYTPRPPTVRGRATA